MIESVWQDLRYAARVLGRNRLFAAAAIGTLAVAIGANTAIFSLIDAAFLRPLPYPEPSRLVFLCEGQPSVAYSFSYPRYEMLRDQASAFEGIAAYDDESITASTSGEPERIEGGSCRCRRLAECRNRQRYIRRIVAELRAHTGRDPI